MFVLLALDTIRKEKVNKGSEGNVEYECKKMLFTFVCQALLEDVSLKPNNRKITIKDDKSTNSWA